MVNRESFMALEQARMHTVAKPWGCADLRPWNGYHDTRAAIGEACFERADPAALCSRRIFDIRFICFDICEPPYV
jgi:hypothetical protein